MADLRNVYWFLQPTIAAALCFLAVLLCAYVVSGGGAADSEAEAVARLATTVEELVLPQPSLRPTEVVKIQLAGLARANRADGAVQCMSFASPQNRAVTGPLEKFGRMVRRPPFDILSNPEATLIGKPTFVDGVARVLVTVSDGPQIRSFVWVLSRQSQPPFQGCWMTDAVFPLQTQPPQPPASLDLTDAA